MQRVCVGAANKTVERSSSAELGISVRKGTFVDHVLGTTVPRDLPHRQRNESYAFIRVPDPIILMNAAERPLAEYRGGCGV